MSKETLNEQPIEKIFNHIGKCCLDKLDSERGKNEKNTIKPDREKEQGMAKG